MKSKATEGYIYLIGEMNNPNIYKIGMTRNKNVEERMKKLQTGNSEELYIRYTFFSNHITKLEKMLHNYYKNQNSINEWFTITDEEANNFLNICQKYQRIIDSLKENPYF